MTRLTKKSKALCVFVGLAQFAAGCAAKREARSHDKAAEMPQYEDMAARAAPERSEARGAAGEESKAELDGKGTHKPGAATWKRSTLEAHTSRLMIGDREELPLRGMQIHARVDGFRARVMIDFFFANDTDRQYEGTFKLRLPEGASPYFLAFGQDRFEEPMYIARGDIAMQKVASEDMVAQRKASWIDPKIARMVPRETAARAYGDTVRRAVDPALLEWGGAGVFNARIFPIAPHKLHRVVIGYDVNLTRVAGDLELQIPVPPKLPSSVVHLDVATPGGTRLEIAGAQTSQGQGRTFAEVTGAAGQVVTARLRNAGAMALTGTDETGSYFAAEVEPALPRAAAAPVRRAVFAIDTSMSSNPDKFNVWLALLRSILDQSRGHIDEFAVYFFNVEGHWWKRSFVANTPANVTEAVSRANQLALEGATDLGLAVRESARPDWLRANASGQHSIFLLSDGAATWGEDSTYAISRGLADTQVASLFAYRTGMAGGDTQMLEHLARESGGAVFSVVGESEVAAAARAHAATPWRIDSIDVAGATDVLIAGRPTAIFPGQRLYIAGRGPIEQSTAVTLKLSRGNTAKTVVTKLAQVVASPLAPRAYGQLAVGQLEEFLGSTQTFAGAYARHFRVTGKTTSLLMLDSEQDYLRHNIAPADDAGVVARTAATSMIGEALAALAELLGDPKHAFLLREDLPGRVRDLLAKLPPSAFAAQVPALIARDRTWGAIPQSVRAQLRERKPDYDALSAEALRRRSTLGPTAALRGLSSLVEANPGDTVLARDVAFTAMEWGMHAHAIHLLRRVERARPWEPQTIWALARALAEMGEADLALAYFEIGATREWDSRFGEFKRIVLLDYIRFLNHSTAKLSPALAGFANQRALELQRQFGIDRADLLVTIMWNTDNTDVDLHVIEPSGEECLYSHPETRSGGQLTQDVTQGYGPEMFVHRSAPRGTYKIRAHYFASDTNRASARSKVYATITTGWGTPNETVVRKVVTLEAGKDIHDLAITKL